MNYIKNFELFISESIESSRKKMKYIVDDLLKKEKGGREYFNKIDNSIKLPANLDIIKDTFDYIRKNNENFNLILTGGFGDWILSLIKKGVLEVPNNLVLVNGSLRGKNNKLNKITQGYNVDIVYKKNSIDNQEFILFDDSYYSGSTKNAIDNFLKKHNSHIKQTYALYDGNDTLSDQRKSLYRYYNYNKGTKISPDKLLNYLHNLNLDIPLNHIENKISKGKITTLRELNTEINKILKFLNKKEIDIKDYNRRKELQLKEDIDWTFEDDEEKYEPKPLNKNDHVKINGKVNFWNSYKRQFIDTNVFDRTYIDDIKKTEDIYRDDIIRFDKGTIPHDGWLIKLVGHWPWFIYDDKVIKKIK